MRATCRVRSRSTSAAGAVHVRVRSMACRISADSGTPAAAALARQAPNKLASVPPVRRANSSTGACSPGPSKSPYHYIEEAAFCPVNHAKREDIPRGPARYQSPARPRRRTLEPPPEDRLNQRVASVAIGCGGDRVLPCKAWTPAHTLQRSDCPAGVSARSQRDHARRRGFSYREREPGVGASDPRRR